MAWNTILNNKTQRPFIWFLGFILMASIWYIEKTKWIPQYGMVFYEMGVRCENKCGGNKQLQYFQKAVRYNPKINDAYHNPKFSDAYYRLALIYEEKGAYDRALESFRRSVEFDSRNTSAYYNMGLHYFREGAYELALRSFLQSHRQSGYPGDADYYLARIYDKKKEYNLAIEHYHEFISRNPEDAAIFYPRVAELYYLLNQKSAVLWKIQNLREGHNENLADQLEQAFSKIFKKELK